MAGVFSLFDHVTPIFYRTEVGAHDPNLYRRQIVGWKGPIFYHIKSFHFNFLSMKKKRSMSTGYNAPAEATKLVFASWRESRFVASAGRWGLKK